jgi:hypothetical protein
MDIPVSPFFRPLRTSTFPYLFDRLWIAANDVGRLAATAKNRALERPWFVRTCAIAVAVFLLPSRDCC